MVAVNRRLLTNIISCSLPEFTCNFKKFVVWNFMWADIFMPSANCQRMQFVEFFPSCSAAVLQTLMTWQFRMPLLSLSLGNNVNRSKNIVYTGYRYMNISGSWIKLAISYSYVSNFSSPKNVKTRPTWDYYRNIQS